MFIRYGTGYDLASRPKNATRESTATLKVWINEHKKNPYPTKGEKIMLAIITKMTLTQVSYFYQLHTCTPIFLTKRKSLEEIGVHVILIDKNNLLELKSF